MNSALPPPFGTSLRFTSRNTLEGITLVSLLIGVPAATVAVVVAIVLLYCFCKKWRMRNVLEKKRPCTSCSEAAAFICAALLMIIAVLLVAMFVVPLFGAVIFSSVVIILLGALLGTVLGVIGILIGGTLRLIPFTIDKIILKCRKARCTLEANEAATPPEQNEGCCQKMRHWVSSTCSWEKIHAAVDISTLWDKTSAAISSLFFSSVTERWDTGKNSGVELVIAKRKEPEAGIRKHAVRLYFVTAAVLALLWFLVLLVDNFWYQKVATCNDVNIDNDNFVCYLIDDKGRHMDPVNCTDTPRPQHVLCYIFTFSPFMALGIAGSVTRSIVFAADIAINVALKLAEKECGCAILVFVQIVAVCFSAVFSIAIPVRHVAQGKDLVGWFFQGPTAPRVFVYILTAISIAVLPMVPWWAFKGKRFIDTSREDPESQGTYLSLDKTKTNTEKRRITWFLEVYTHKAESKPPEDQALNLNVIQKYPSSQTTTHVRTHTL